MKMSQFLATSALVLLIACNEEEPGPVVMTLGSGPSAIDIAANQLKGLSIQGDGLSTALAFRMNSDHAQAFSELTRDNIGSLISIAICGEVVSEPMVMEQISGGSALITGYSVSELEVFLKKLDGSEPC